MATGSPAAVPGGAPYGWTYDPVREVWNWRNQNGNVDYVQRKLNDRELADIHNQGQVYLDNPAYPGATPPWQDAALPPAQQAQVGARADPGTTAQAPGNQAVTIEAPTYQEQYARLRQAADGEGRYHWVADDTGHDNYDRQVFTNRETQRKSDWDNAQGQQRNQFEQEQDALDAQWQNQQRQKEADWNRGQDVAEQDWYKQGHDRKTDLYQRQVYQREARPRATYQANPYEGQQYQGKPQAVDLTEQGKNPYDVPGGITQAEYTDAVRSRENKSLWARAGTGGVR